MGVGAQHFVLTNMSSLLCLIAEVVYACKTTGNCPDRLAKAFKSLRVTLYLTASAEDIVNLNAAENTDQFKRKQHSELDNISTVLFWQKKMGAHPQLSPHKALDVFKYALVVDDPRGAMPSWFAALLKNKAPTMSNKILALADKGVTKKQLDNMKAQPTHVQISIVLRHRRPRPLPERLLRGGALALVVSWRPWHDGQKRMSPPFPVPSSFAPG